MNAAFSFYSGPLLSGPCTTWTAAPLSLCAIITPCTRGGGGHLHGSSGSGSQGRGWSSRNDVVYFSSLIPRPFFPCISSSSICIPGPAFGAAAAQSRYRGAAAAGDTPEDMLLKHVFTAKSRLGSGGPERRYLFESLHSVCWCPRGCAACYPWIKTQLDGAMRLSSNPPTFTLDWAPFILLFDPENAERLPTSPPIKFWELACCVTSAVLGTCDTNTFKRRQKGFPRGSAAPDI